MATYVEKFCISLWPESLAQLEWIQNNVLHISIPIPRSQLIRMVINYAYYDGIKKYELNLVK